MPLKAPDLLPRRRVPEPDRVVETRRREGLTVGAPGDGVDRVGMSVQRRDEGGRLLRPFPGSPRLRP